MSLMRIAQSFACSTRAVLPSVSVLGARLFSGAADEEYKPHRGYLLTPFDQPRKESKYPVPPQADGPGIIFENAPEQDPALNKDLPYTLDRSEGVTVLTITEGPKKGTEVVLPSMNMTLEWCLPSPPPFHTFEEPPVIKENPE